GLIAAGSLVGVGGALVWRHRDATERRETAVAIWLGVALAVLVLTIPWVHAAALRIAPRFGVAPWDTGTVAVSAGALLVAFGLTWSLTRLDLRRSAVSDLVIELGAGGSTGLAAELRRVLGDPSLTIGIWREASERFEDDAGRAVTVPAAGTPGVAIIED